MSSFIRKQKNRAKVGPSPSASMLGRSDGSRKEKEKEKMKVKEKERGKEKEKEEKEKEKEKEKEREKEKEKEKENEGVVFIEGKGEEGKVSVCVGDKIKILDGAVGEDGFALVQKTNGQKGLLHTSHFCLVTKSGMEVQMNDRGLLSFPDILQSLLPHVHRLDVSGNKWGELPVFRWGDLVAVRATKCMIASLEPGISSLSPSTLVELNLHHNKITRIPHAIGRLSRLESLTLSHNALTRLSSSLFSNLKNLRRLSLHHNHLSSLPPSLFENNGELVRLYLNNNKLEQVPASVAKLTKLKELHLYNNPYKDVAVHHFALLSPTLAVATFRHYFWNGAKETESWEWKIHAALTSNSQLQKLSLEHCQLSSKQAEILCVALKSNQTLYRIGLGHEALSNPSVDLARVVSAMVENTSIRVLDLSGNKLLALPNELPRLQSLHTLFIQKNLLSALPSSFSELQQLTWLNMSSNKFTTLPEQLSCQPSLKSLDITHNKISVIPKWLKNNHNIQVNIDSFTKKAMKKGGASEVSVVDISTPRQFRQKIHITNELEWDMEDPKTSFVFVSKLGQGAYGKVYEAKHVETGMLMAIKSVEMSEKESNDLKKEVDVLRQLQHANIVQLYGCLKVGRKTWILMEVCGTGSCMDILRHHPDGCFSEDVILSVLFPVLQGLIYLHHKQIVHRDIKSANILINKDGVVKIADFGISSCVDVSQNAKTVIGTPLFMSPEVVEGKPYTFNADVWSLGITAIEFAEGYPPHFQIGRDNPLRAMSLIATSPAPTLSNHSKFSPEFFNFVQNCVQKNPNRRENCTALISSPFMRGALQKNCRKILGDMLEIYQAHIPQKKEKQENLNIDTFALAPSLSTPWTSLPPPSSSRPPPPSLAPSPSAPSCRRSRQAAPVPLGKTKNMPMMGSLVGFEKGLQKGLRTWEEREVEEEMLLEMELEKEIEREVEREIEERVKEGQGGRWEVAREREVETEKLVEEEEEEWTMERRETPQREEREERRTSWRGEEPFEQPEKIDQKNETPIETGSKQNELFELAESMALVREQTCKIESVLEKIIQQLEI